MGFRLRLAMARLQRSRIAASLASEDSKQSQNFRIVQVRKDFRDHLS